ncbi:ATP-binding protein [Streptomyces sp. 900116325]
MDRQRTISVSEAPISTVVPVSSGRQRQQLARSRDHDQVRRTRSGAVWRALARPLRALQLIPACSSARCPASPLIVARPPSQAGQQCLRVRLQRARDPGSGPPTARKRAARVLWAWGLHEDGLCTALLVISELVDNAVQHAVSYSGRPTITLTRRRTNLVLAVHDEHPFLPQPVPTANPGRECGRGLMIVDSLVREAGGALQVRRAPRGNEVRAVIPAADFTDSADLAVSLPAACPVMHLQRPSRPRARGGAWPRAAEVKRHAAAMDGTRLVPEVGRHRFDRH